MKRPMVAGLAMVVALFALALAAEAQAPSTPACGSAAQPFQSTAPFLSAAGAFDLQQAIPGLNPAPQEKGPVCPFCNLTNYSSCDSLNGTSCSTTTNRRCYVEPACYCEWGICLCQNGAWNCIY